MSLTEQNHAKQMKFPGVPIKGQITDVRQFRGIHTVRGQTVHAKLRERAGLALFPFAGFAQIAAAVAHTKNIITQLTQLYHQTAYGICMLGFDG